MSGSCVDRQTIWRLFHFIRPVRNMIKGKEEQDSHGKRNWEVEAGSFTVTQGSKGIQAENVTKAEEKAG
ncbi:MAG TPA: hypothetical protein VLL97_05490 [Acidobacteriota bacterium]|nr:hypothetical protein [Acidobacteriota bacterium]